MDDLYQALGDLRSIRRQMARATEFRGYGPVTLACTGVFAVLAAVVQECWAGGLAVYLKIWMVTAVLSAALTGVQMLRRTRRIHSGLSNEMLRMAAEQFLPSLGAGLLLTVVILWYAPASVFMLPGLWQIVYGLGVFASCRFLPRPMVMAGCWYLLAGLSCVAIGDERALTPWNMGVPFGAGQMLIAAILWRSHAETADER
jgi:hypothetical protein